jgi:hypothetical protein
MTKVHVETRCILVQIILFQSCLNFHEISKKNNPLPIETEMMSEML